MTGNYRNSVDNKGRITIPSKFRKELDGKIFLSLGFEKTLSVRSEKEYKSFKDKILSMDTLTKKVRILQRVLLGNTIEVELDNQGRALLPKTLLDSANIKDKVVISALGNQIEIIAEEAYDKMLEDAMSGGLEDAAEALYETRD